MIRRLLFLGFLFMILAGCSSGQSTISEMPPEVDAGVDPETWALVPAGAFLSGQHDHETLIDYDYTIMVTDVTNAQFAAYLNQALADGWVRLEGEAVLGVYPGDVFHAYKHEMEIPAGDYVHVQTAEEGPRIQSVGGIFTPQPGFENHPVVQVTWFGARGYCEYYGWRLPLEVEWEKSARGPDDRPYPWGDEIGQAQANFYSSHDLFEKMVGGAGGTTPVGFYSGRNYHDFQTQDSASPYGLYDMAGNVWQWTGDVYEDQHYRYMRGGSLENYAHTTCESGRATARPLHMPARASVFDVHETLREGRQEGTLIKTMRRKSRVTWSLIKSLQTGLLLTTGLAGFMSARCPVLNLPTILGLTASLFLAISGSTVLNMWYDRDIDAQMARTCHRPLPTGEADPKEALLLGLLLAVSGTGWALLIDPLYGLVVLAGLIFDVGVYTVWLKRRSAWSIIWGGIAGGMPVLAGRTLGLGAIDWIGLALCLGVLFWIPTHIMTFNMRYTKDYERAEVPTFPKRYGFHFTRVVIAISSVLAALAMATALVGIGCETGPLILLGLFSFVLFILAVRSTLRPSARLNYGMFKYASLYMMGAMLLLVVTGL